MNNKNIKKLVYSIFVFLLLYCVFVVIFNSYKTIVHRINFLSSLGLVQRISALMAFIVISIPIPLGGFMDKLKSKLGNWLQEFYFTNSALLFFLILIHPISYFLFLTIARHTFDPFYIFSDFCLLCPTRNDLFLTFGRVSFWFLLLITISVLFRKSDWWKKNRKNIQLLNYIIFPLIAIHSWFLGEDIRKPLFIGIFLLGVLFYLITLSVKKINWLGENLNQ